MQVSVRDNNVDQAYKVLKKKLQREGVFREMKLRNHYEKPSENAPAKKRKACAVFASWPVRPRSAKAWLSASVNTSLRPSQNKKAPLFSGAFLLSSAFCLEGLNDILDHFLGVREQHHRVVAEE